MMLRPTILNRVRRLFKGAGPAPPPVSTAALDFSDAANSQYIAIL